MSTKATWRVVGGATLALGTMVAEGVGMEETTLRVTGRDLVVNGIAELPRLLFSVHAAPLSPEIVADWGVEGVRLIHHVPSGQPSRAPVPFVLECLYDRYQPALTLIDPHWERHLVDLARRYAAALAGPLARTHAIEFWNEPYLNWASKPGVNYDGLHFDQANAAPGGIPRLRFADIAPTNLVWDAPRLVAILLAEDAAPTESELLRLERNAFPDYLATRFMPAGLERGALFRWRDRPYVAVRRWWARDPTQPSWWSGTFNRDAYLAMATVFARTLKEARPEAVFVAGWGFHLFESNWRAWDLLHRPTLDALQAWIDGYGEHHYGTDPLRVAASYEIADGYMRSRWGRRIGFWNTEAGGVQDPERPDTLRPLATGRSLEEARGAAAYFLRSILTMLRYVPDKARMRCAHEPQVNSGVPAAFRLLKPLRGALVETQGSDDGVWCVAARQPGRLTVTCYNSTRHPRTVTLEVRAPAGTGFAGLERRRLVERDDAVHAVAETGTAAGGVWTGAVTLPPGAAEVLVFALAGEARPPRVRREQFVGDETLQEVAAGKGLRVRIAIPAAELARAERASVRWVFASASATLRVTCNGVALTPPANAFGPFREVPVDPALLRTATHLDFALDGWESTVIGTASVFLERTEMFDLSP